MAENYPDGILPTFPLPRVYENLLAKIIPKLKSNADYVRMRGTCKLINEVAENCFVFLDGQYEMLIAEAPEVLNKLYICHVNPCVDAKADSLYRVRLGTLFLFRGILDIEAMLKYAIDHQITCAHLALGSTRKWTVNECTTLMSILKPTQIFLDSRDSDRYTALLQSGILKKITVLLNFQDVFNLARIFVYRFEEVTIAVDSVETAFLNNDHDHWIDNMLSLVEELKESPSPVLKKFTFIYQAVVCPCHDELLRRFYDYKPSQKNTSEKDFSFWLPGKGADLEGPQINMKAFTNLYKKFEDVAHFDPVMYWPE